MNSGLLGAIKLGKELGLKTKIITLPSDTGQKVDINSYFNENHTAKEFEVLKNEAKEVVEVLLLLIPKDIRKVDIKEALGDVFDYLLNLDELDAISRLNNFVQPYFGFSKAEFSDYIKYFKLLRKNRRSATNNLESNDTEKTVFKSFIETDEFLVEQIKNDNAIAEHADDAELSQSTSYLVFNKGTEKIELVKEFEYQGVTYKPVVDDLFTTGTVLLPTGILEYGSTENLVKEIREFLNKYFEVPLFFKEFLPYLCLFYWVFEKFPFVPYVHFVGRTGTGKTTALEVFGSICYKRIDASGSITLSPIFRSANTWKGTLLLDEFEASGDNYKAIIAFLKSGVGNRAVLRTEGENVKEVRAYIVKSPKIFTSENPITDAGLQSRTIVVRMQKNRNKVPLFRIGSFNTQAQELRNKLLLWRFRNYDKINLASIEYGFPELNAFDGRVQQVITPIYYLSDEETRKSLLDFAKEQESETKRERRDSLNGQVFQIIVDLLDAREPLLIKTITSKLNAENAEISQPKSEKKVASIVRTILGLEVVQLGHKKESTVIVTKETEKYKELSSYYGIEITSPASSASTALNEEDSAMDYTEIFDGGLGL